MSCAVRRLRRGGTRRLPGAPSVPRNRSARVGVDDSGALRCRLAAQRLAQRGGDVLGGDGRLLPGAPGDEHAVEGAAVGRLERFEVVRLDELAVDGLEADDL